MSNPGDFRIEIAAAKSEGFFDLRNGAMMKMFYLIDIGESSGIGIPSIYNVWKSKAGANRQYLRLSSQTGSLYFFLSARVAIKPAIKSQNKEAIIDFLTDNAGAKSSEIAKFIGLQQSHTRDYLKELTAKGMVIPEGSNKNRIYKHKS